MANPLVWSKFPEHLLPYVIEGTQDFKTIKNWNLATKGNYHLNHVAARLQWRSFTFSKKTMLRVTTATASNHTYCKAKLRSDLNRDAEISEAVREPPGSQSQIPKPATLIKCLKLNFQSGWERGLDDQNVLDNVLYSLSVLLPQVHSLEDIEHYGPLHQDHLDQLLQVSGLTGLKLRSFHSYGMRALRGHHSAQAFPLELKNLVCQSSLTVLEISRLVPAEATQLAEAVVCLVQLRHLRIVAAEDWHLGNLGPVSPVLIFLERLHPNPEAEDYVEIVEKGDCGLPVLLRSLALIDRYPISATPRVRKLPPKSSTRSLLFLTSLYLEMPQPKVPLELLRLYKPCNLTHLSLWSSSNTGDMLDRHLIYDVLSSQCPNIEAIVLLNLWKNLNLKNLQDKPYWTTFKGLQQIHLAKPPPKHRNDYIQNIWQENLSVRIFGYTPESLQWGSDIQHLRIDQLDHNTVRVDSIDLVSQGLKQLKVLVLRPPLNQSNGPWIWNLEYQPYSKYTFGPPIPQSMDYLREARVAKMIADQDLPNLRLIAISEYRFWVQRKPKSKKDSKARLWFLRRALEDPKQEHQILKTINSEDWDFLGGKSRILKDEGRENCQTTVTGKAIFFRTKDEINN